jgi:hypothetical protein
MNEFDAYLLEQQLTLIRSGNHKKIMLKLHLYFEPKAQVALIERGNYEEIFQYLRYNYRFCPAAVFAITKRGDVDDLIEYIAERFKQLKPHW